MEDDAAKLEKRRNRAAVCTIHDNPAIRESEREEDGRGEIEECYYDLGIGIVKRARWRTRSVNDTSMYQTS